MKAAFIPILILLICLGGCWSDDAKPVPTATEVTTLKVGDAVKAKDSANAASAAEIGKAATVLPASPEKAIIAGEASVIGGRSGPPEKKDTDEAAARSAKVKAGAADAVTQYDAEKTQAIKDRDDLRLLLVKAQQEIADNEQKEKDRIKALADEKDRSMWSYIGATFVTIGILLTVVCVYFRLSPLPGLLLAGGGILAVATGRLLNSDIFMFAVGAVIVAVGAGVAWVLVDGFIKSRKAKLAAAEREAKAEVTDYTLATVTGKFDELVFKSPLVSEDVKKQLRAALSGAMDEEHKAVIRAAKANAITNKLI